VHNNTRKVVTFVAVLSFTFGALIYPRPYRWAFDRGYDAVSAVVTRTGKWFTDRLPDTPTTPTTSTTSSTLATPATTSTKEPTVTTPIATTTTVTTD
jgi:hypothetical protein